MPELLKTLALSGGAAAVVTWALVALLIKLAPRIGLVDLPNDRSLHTRVTPRGGGIGFVITVAAGLGVRLGGVTGPDAAWPLVLLGASLFVAAISLWDDFRSLGAAVRFVTHSVAAAATLWLVGRVGVAELPGFGSVALGWTAVPLTLLWLVGLTNVYNFMDGIDGIAGVQGFVAGLAWAIAGAWFDWPCAATLGALFAGGSCGFLLHNWSPAKIFMGDVGSAFLGYLFAAILLLALREAAEHAANFSTVGGRLPVFAVLTLWPFVGDGALTLVRRSLKREPVWKAHRSHLYQRLVQSGWPHARVSLLYGVWAVLSVGVAWWWLVGGAHAAPVAWAFPLGTLAVMFGFVSARERAAKAGRK